MTRNPRTVGAAAATGIIALVGTVLMGVQPAGARDDAPTAQLAQACATGPFRVPAALFVVAGSGPVDVVAGDVEVTLVAFESQTVEVPAGTGIDDVTLNGESAGVSAVDGPACPPPDFLPALVSTFQVTFFNGCPASQPPVAAQLGVTEAERSAFPRRFTVDLVVDGELQTFEVAGSLPQERPADAAPPAVVTFAGIAVPVIVESVECDAPSGADDAPSSPDEAPSSGPGAAPLAPRFTG